MRGPIKWMAAAAFFAALLLWFAWCRPQGGAEAQSGTQILFRAMGVFRVFAVDALWMRMNSHIAAGRDGLVLTDARTLLELEPDSDEIRDFLHWHLAFTMAQRALSDADRAEWIEEGLEIAEEGLERNPDSVVLNRGLGMTLFMITDRQDIYRQVCVDRYGRQPVELAHAYLERAYAGSGDLRTLDFLLRALVNAATFEMDRARPDAARPLWATARRLIEEVLPRLSPDEEPPFLNDLLEFCRDQEAECEKLKKAGSNR